MPFGRLFGGGFSSSKCKTSLRLCVGRIKLLRNKKSLATRALISEVADLLRAEKDDAARVRVEGVMREEGVLEVFEILDVFLELLIARLPMIEASKDVPADLREALATVMFAASKLAAELPELASLREQFAVKYGKAFAKACSDDATAGACGANAIACARLATRSPDPLKKVERLAVIADEHGIDAFDVAEATKRTLASAAPPLGTMGGGAQDVPRQVVPQHVAMPMPMPQPVTYVGVGQPRPQPAAVAVMVQQPAVQFNTAGEAAAYAAAAADDARNAAAAAAVLAGAPSPEARRAAGDANSTVASESTTAADEENGAADEVEVDAIVDAAKELAELDRADAAYLNELTPPKNGKDGGGSDGGGGGGDGGGGGAGGGGDGAAGGDAAKPPPPPPPPPGSAEKKDGGTMDDLTERLNALKRRD